MYTGTKVSFAKPRRTLKVVEIRQQQLRVSWALVQLEPRSNLADRILAVPDLKHVVLECLAPQHELQFVDGEVVWDLRFLGAEDALEAKRSFVIFSGSCKISRMLAASQRSEGVDLRGITQGQNCRQNCEEDVDRTHDSWVGAELEVQP